MKRMTAAALLFTALSAPALAETPSQREMHSWSYVQSVANPAPAAPQEAPMVTHHEPRPYYHHESSHHVSNHMHHHHHTGKHHGSRHAEKGKVHHKGKHHHHHHTMKSTKATDASGSGTASPAETK